MSDNIKQRKNEKNSTFHDSTAFCGDLLGDPEGGPLLTINSRDASRIDYHGTYTYGVGSGASALNLLRAGIKVGIDLASPMDN